MKRLVSVLLITLIVFTLLACSKSDTELKLGVYVTKDEVASLTLLEDNHFSLNRHLVTSYDPSGNYKIDGNNLLLYINEDETQIIKFIISGDKLIFESGEIAESLIEKGTEFILQED